MKRPTSPPKSSRTSGDISRCPTSCPGPTGFPSRPTASRSSRRPALSSRSTTASRLPVTLDVGALTDEVTVAAASAAARNDDRQRVDVAEQPAGQLASGVRQQRDAARAQRARRAMDRTAELSRTALQRRRIRHATPPGGVGGSEYSLDGVSNSAAGAARRLPALHRHRRGNQSRNRQLRRVERPHQRRHRQRAHQERHQRVSRQRAPGNTGTPSGTPRRARRTRRTTARSRRRSPMATAPKPSGCADSQSRRRAFATTGRPCSAGRSGCRACSTARDKLFFFFSYNGFKDVKAEEVTAVNRTVPTEAQRRGDFSDLLRIDPVRYQIYDPRTARLENGRVVRDPFPNNQVPILNPLYQHYLPLYPAAEQSRRHRLSRRSEQLSRVGDAIQLGLQGVQHARRLEPLEPASHVRALELERLHRGSGDWTYETARGLMSNGLVRQNLGATVDHVFVQNGTTIWNASIAFNRFTEGNRRNDVQTSFSPCVRRIPRLHGRPRPRDRRRARTCRASTSATTRIPTSASICGGFTDFSVITARGELAKILSTHSVKTGVDVRAAPPREHRGRQHVGRDVAPQRLRPPARQHQQRRTARARMGGVHARRDRHHDGQQHEPHRHQPVLRGVRAGRLARVQPLHAEPRRALRIRRRIRRSRQPRDRRVRLRRGTADQRRRRGRLPAQPDRGPAVDRRARRQPLRGAERRAGSAQQRSVQRDAAPRRGLEAQ